MRDEDHPWGSRMRGRRGQLVLLLIAGLFALVRLVFVSGIPAHRIDDVPHAVLASGIAERIRPAISGWHATANDVFTKHLAQWKESLLAQRTAFQLPLAVSIVVFGYSKTALLLPSFLYSGLAAVLVYWTCRRIWNPKTACLALILLAFAPLDVFAATSLQVDSAVGFYHAMAFYFLAWGTPDISGRKGALAFTLAGLSVGLSYLGKQPGVLMLPILVVYARLFAGNRWLRLSGIGIVSCLIPIALRTLYAMSVEGAGLLDEYEVLYHATYAPVYEPPSWKQLLGLNLLVRFGYPFSDEQFGNGALGLALLMALAWSIKLWRNLDGYARCLVFWIISVPILLNYAPVPIKLLPYRPAIGIQTRYLLPIVFPGAMLLAWYLARMRSRARVPLLALLVLFNILTVAANWALFSDRKEDPAVRALQRISREFPNEVPVYAASRTAGHLNLLPPKKDRAVVAIPDSSGAAASATGGLVLIDELHLRQDFSDKGKPNPDVLAPDDSRVVFLVPSMVAETYSFKMLRAVTSGSSMVLGGIARFDRFQERLWLRERPLRVQVVP